MLRRALRGLLILALVIFSALGTLLFATPSVVSAKQLVREKALSHGQKVMGSMPPRRFIESLVATEDHRFYSWFDPGIDPIAILRVVAGMVDGRRGDLGGSTITQQLGKMLYGPSRQGKLATLEQIAIALKLGLNYSKHDIVTMYSEVAYYGDGYYGLRQASCGYFGKRPTDLNWRQAALLAGIVNAPSADDPRDHLRRADRRVQHVFGRLRAVGALTPLEVSTAEAEPLGLVPRGTCHQE